MSYEIINIPAPYDYINKVPEFKKDVPDNVYIDKTVCGCGFTTAVLQNDIDYIVAVPFKSLGDNKLIQAKDDPDYKYELFMYHSGIEQVNLKLDQYLKRNIGTTKKILVTYDSISKLESYVDFKDYKLFIDEGHKILEYAGNFKPKVIHNLMNRIHDFKSFVVCTATPTREEFIPVELKDVKKLKLNWSKSVQVTFNHKRINQNQLRDTVLSICLGFLRGAEEGNLYLYYNSVSSIVKICKDLKTKYGISKDQIKIICADTDNNKKSLKTLGSGWRPKQAIEEDELNEKGEVVKFYKINFITSTAFEGQDFLDPIGKTYIVSDGKLEHTKLDISTQVSQITGRLRKSTYKDVINMIWTVSPTLEITDEESYKAYLKEQEDSAKALVKSFNDVSDNIRAQCILINGTTNDPFLIDTSDKDGPNLIVNPNGMNHMMNTFIGTTLQYFVNMDEERAVETVNDKVKFSLNEVFSGTVEDSLDIPVLSPADKKKLGKKPNFGKAVKQYINTMIQLRNNKFLSEEEKSILEDIKINFETDPDFEIVLDYIQLFGIKELVNLEEVSIQQSKIAKKVHAKQQENTLKALLQMKFKPDEVYSNKELKELLEPLYSKYGLEGTPKASDINLAFVTQKTTRKEDGKLLACLKLVEKL